MKIVEIVDKLKIEIRFSMLKETIDSETFIKIKYC